MTDKHAYTYEINKRTRLAVAKHELLTFVAWPAVLPSKYKIDSHPRLIPQQIKFELFHNKFSVMN